MQPGGTSEQLLGVDAVREFNILQRHLWRRIRQASGRPSHHRHAIAEQINGTGPSSSFCGTTPWTRPIFSIWVPLLLFGATSLAARWADRFRRTRPSCSRTMKDSARIFIRPSVAYVPDARVRTASALRCSVPSILVSGSPCGGLGMSRRTTPDTNCLNEIYSLLNLWPVANGPDQGTGIAQANYNPLQTIRDDFGTARVDHIFSGKDSIGAVYTVDDSADKPPPILIPICPTSYEPARASLSIEETHVFSLDTAQHGAFWFLPRELLFYRRAYSRHTCSHSFRILLRPSCRRRRRGRQRRIQSRGANCAGRQQQRKQSGRP